MATIQHNVELCGKPDREEKNRAAADADPPLCCCCGSQMYSMDCTSEGMNQLGMYWLICPTCPTAG